MTTYAVQIDDCVSVSEHSIIYVDRLTQNSIAVRLGVVVRSFSLRANAVTVKAMELTELKSRAQKTPTIKTDNRRPRSLKAMFAVFTFGKIHGSGNMEA